MLLYKEGNIVLIFGYRIQLEIILVVIILKCFWFDEKFFESGCVVKFNVMEEIKMIECLINGELEV